MKLVALLVSAAVSIIVISSVLVPVIDNADHDLSITDVIIVDGQSNAEDWRSFSTTINTEYTETPAEDLYYYGSNDSVTHYNDNQTAIDQYGLHPMYSNGSWVVGGYAAPLCNGYAQKNGHDVCYINIGYSGQSITALEPSGAVGAWGFKIVSDALTVIKNTYDLVNIIGWIWIQGEADKDMSIDTYTEDFELIQSKFKTYGADDCYIVHTREYYGGNATIAQQQIADSDDDVEMTCMFTEDFTVEGGELFADGPIHYTQKGRILIAAGLVDAIPRSTVDGYNFEILNIIPLFAIIAVLLAVVFFVVRRE